MDSDCAFMSPWAESQGRRGGPDPCSSLAAMGQELNLCSWLLEALHLSVLCFYSGEETCTAEGTGVDGLRGLALVWD